ncbi:MAG TPA: imelysin family protein [Kineosporiaceae bacterium]
MPEHDSPPPRPAGESTASSESQAPRLLTSSDQQPSATHAPTLPASATDAALDQALLDALEDARASTRDEGSDPAGTPDGLAGHGSNPSAAEQPPGRPTAPLPVSPALPQGPANGPAPLPAPRSRGRGKLLIGAGAVAGLAAVGTVVGLTGGLGTVKAQLSGGAAAAPARPVSSGSDAQPLVVTTTSCGNGWSLKTTGAAAFAVSNQAGKSAEVTLRSTADDAIIAEIEGLPPKVTRQLSTVVNPGTYYWLCQFRDATSTKSEVVKITGPTVPVAEPLLEVTEDDMTQPVAQYKTYVAGQLGLLRTQVATLRSDLAAGNAATARADWLTAHLTYHRIGAAYNAFGDDGKGVDGLAQGLPDGTNDKDFTGFHKIEKLLWSGVAPRSVLGEADTLVAKVDVLVTKLPKFTFDPNDISLRTHEILEGTGRFELTGADDYGSGTSLATAAADVEGTQQLVKILEPLVDARQKGLPATLTKQLTALSAAIQSTKVDGQWVPVGQVPETRRRQINGLTGGALESLSVIPDMLEIRK